MTACGETLRLDLKFIFRHHCSFWKINCIFPADPHKMSVVIAASAVFLRKAQVTHTVFSAEFNMCQNTESVCFF